jgi:hypothetical protein
MNKLPIQAKILKLKEHYIAVTTLDRASKELSTFLLPIYIKSLHHKSNDEVNFFFKKPK